MNRPIAWLAVTAFLTLAPNSLALQGPRSSLVGANFTADAVIVTDRSAVAEFAGTLRDAATAAGGSCQKSEYVVWPEAAEGLEEQFNSGLKALGYTYTLLDQADEADGYVSVFRLDKAGQALAGLWVEADGNAILGWCILKLAQAQAPVKPAPAPKPAPKPQPQAAPAAPARPAPAPAQAARPPVPKRGYVSGVVLDTQGRPLAGARVYLEGTTFTQGQRTSFETQTGRDGSYALRVPDGRYHAKASYTTQYGGSTYSFLLYPESGNPRTEVDSSEGGNLNFRWKLSGLTAYSAPGASRPDDFYGASVNFSYCGLPAAAYCDARYTEVTPGAAPGGSTITVTLTPRGPLVDGTAGKPVTYTFKAAPLSPPGGYPYTNPNGGGRTVLGEGWPYHSKDFNDLPLGQYVLTATATLPGGGTRPLKLGTDPANVEATSLNVTFAPWDDFNPASYIGGGLKQFRVYVRD